MLKLNGLMMGLNIKKVSSLIRHEGEVRKDGQANGGAYPTMQFNIMHIMRILVHTIWYIPTGCAFPRSDPKTGGDGSSLTPPARSVPLTQDVAVLSAKDDAICCVPPLPRDCPLPPINERFAYSLTVVHFRKVAICQKVGSPGNGLPII